MNRLFSVISPPAAPVWAGDPCLWNKIEQQLGTPLPSDYKEIVNTYGAGRFCDFLWTWQPFAPSGSYNGLSFVQEHLDLYALFRESQEDTCPFPAFPEAGGLFPCGGDDNAGRLYWKTNESINRWTMVYFDREHLEYEEYDVPLSEFLARWLTGAIAPRMIPDCFSAESTLAQGKPLFVR